VWHPVSNHVLGRQDGAFLRYLIACSVCLSHLFYVLLTSRFKDLRTYSLLTMICSHVLKIIYVFNIVVRGNKITLLFIILGLGCSYYLVFL
jgi:hypothetical protein